MTQQAQHGFDLDQTFVAARQQQAEGRLDEAKRLYGKIMGRVPHHAESLIMLASIAYQQGDEVQAEAYLDRAIGIYQAVLKQMPGLLRVHAPLVNVLLARRRPSEAEGYAETLQRPIHPIRAEPAEFERRRRDGMARKLPVMLINTVPKSASESIWNKLAEGLNLAQGHLSLGLFPDCCLLPHRVRAAAQGGLIAKEHISATPFNLKVLAESGLDRVVCHLRDPRQATLSWVHFVRDDVSMRLMAPIWRKIVPPSGLAGQDLAAQIDWSIENYLPLLIEFIRGWREVQQDAAQPVKVLFLGFEEFRVAPEAYFSKVLDFYGIDPSRFVQEKEAEVVHLRKGLLGEWREVFSAAQQERAWSLIPAELAEAFGWQP
ncbi:MAG: tetratricopeptide repeat protein [Rhodospirillales bacterium]|nr:tetratricopeptide repeat protein [Rhodospirillales bacterium]